MPASTNAVAHVAIVSDDRTFRRQVQALIVDQQMLVSDLEVDETGLIDVRASAPPDLIVLDYQCRATVFRSLRRVRRRCPTTAIFVARVENESSGALLLDEGADIVCIVGSPLLPALVNAAARRCRASNADTRIVFGDLILDREHRRVWNAGREMLLSRREYDLVYCLFCHAPRAVGRETLTEFVWGESEHPMPNTVEVYIGYIRRKLLHGSKVAIKTVRGVGYALTNQCQQD